MKRKERKPRIERAEAARGAGESKPATAQVPGTVDLDGSAQLLRSVLQGSPVAKFVIGRDHRVVHWNRALEELSGIPAREVMGTSDHWRAFYRSGARPCLADLLVDGDYKAIETWYAGKCRRSPLIEEAYEATDFFPELGEGGRWLRFTAALIRGVGGEVLGALETLEDITEAKRAEISLRDSEHRLHSVIHGSPIPTFVIGRDHRVIHWNRALEELSGIRAHEVMGTADHWRAFYRSGARPCLADLLVDGNFEAVESWYAGKCRRSSLIEEAYEATDFFPELGEGGRWLRFTAALIRGAGGEVLGALETLENITEQKRAEEELHKAQKMESLSALAGGIAQDFNTLLSAILRNVFLAKISVPDEDKMIEEGLAIAEKAGLRAKELVHLLITVAKGGYPVRKKMDLAPLLRECEALVPREPPIDVRFAIDPDLWPVEADEGQIRQVLRHIVQNAVEAMPEGGAIDIRAGNAVVEASDRLSIREGRYIKISIRDHGRGIREEHLSRIFDPYFTTKEARRGLGLALSYAIIRNHEGLIRVESREGQFSAFHILLPAAEGPEEQK
ncbi:MAG: PAS domain S-box protein [Syntrophaceae bacterium]|nr:PAS domain S-box protein [Syntrophaceae bacterium]